MKIMEAGLRKDPVINKWTKPSVLSVLQFMESEWNSVSKYHMLILTWIKDEQQVEDATLAYEEFQTKYLELTGRIQDALDEEEKVELAALEEAMQAIGGMFIEDEQVEPATIETVLNKAEAGVKAMRNPLAQLMDLKVRVAD